MRSKLKYDFCHWTYNILGIHTRYVYLHSSNWQTFICMNEPKSSEDSHVSFRFFPGWSCNLPRPFFPKKIFYKEKSGLFYVLSLCLYIVHCIHYSTWFTYKSVIQSTLYYLLLVIVTMQLNSLHVFSIYWTSKSMGWLNLNYGEYWSVTSTNKMNKANQFVTYLIFKNFRPLFPGTLRVGFAKQLRPTSNVCNSFWEEQIQSFISKNQFNCLLVTFTLLTT